MKVEFYAPPEFVADLKAEAKQRGKTIGYLIQEAFNGRTFFIRRGSG